MPSYETDPSVPAGTPVQKPHPRGPRIWAVAGGKGGVGKSVITSSLSIALARRGQRCILFDGDLGGANLHTVIGASTAGATLTQFMNGEASSLAEVLQETRFPGLWLISGARSLMSAANPHHAQKQKILRHLRCLDVEHIFLDLGAGTSFTTLDFFLAAPRGILVATPEPTAIENTYHFIKAAFFRSLSHGVKNSLLKNTLRQELTRRSKQGVSKPADLIDVVEEIDPETGAALRERAAHFSPLLVINQARTVEHRRVGREIALACRDYLSTNVEFLGALEYDDYVRLSIAQRKPVLEAYPTAPIVRDVEDLASVLESDEVLEPKTSETTSPSMRQRQALYAPSSLASYGLIDEENAPEPTPSPRPAPEPVYAVPAPAPAPEPEPVREPEATPAPEADPAEAADSLSFNLIDRALRRRSRITSNVFGRFGGKRNQPPADPDPDRSGDAR